MNLQCVGMVCSVAALESCTRYGGCVCLCRVVLQGMVAVFAFVMRLYKV